MTNDYSFSWLLFMGTFPYKHFLFRRNCEFPFPRPRLGLMRKVGCTFIRGWYADFTEQIPALVCHTCWSGLCVMIGRGVAVITWRSWGGMTKLDWSSCHWWSFMKEDTVVFASSCKRGPWICVLRGPIGYQLSSQTFILVPIPTIQRSLLTRDLIFTFHYSSPGMRNILYPFCL